MRNKENTITTQKTGKEMGQKEIKGKHGKQKA